MHVHQATTAQRAPLSSFLALLERIRPTNLEEGQAIASRVHLGTSALSLVPLLRCSVPMELTVLVVMLQLQSVQLVPIAQRALLHPLLVLLASIAKVAASTSSNVKMVLTVRLGALIRSDVLEVPLALATLVMWTWQVDVSPVEEEHTRLRNTTLSASIADQATCAWARPIPRHRRVLLSTRAIAAQRGTTALLARTRKRLVLREPTQRAWVLLMLPLASNARSAGTMIYQAKQAAESVDLPRIRLQQEQPRRASALVLTGDSSSRLAAAFVKPATSRRMGQTLELTRPVIAN